jgi:predicted phosphodiesterase
MRLAIISDVHANLEALRATFHAIELKPPDRIVCLGDIVGYNSSPAECLALLRQAEVQCVAGNHDRAVAGRLLDATLPASAARSIAWTRRQLRTDELDFLDHLPTELVVDGCLLAVHGALHGSEPRENCYLDSPERRRESFLALQQHASGVRVCAFGHTHHAGVWEFRTGHEQALQAEVVGLREDAFYLINPGTVGQPRSADVRASFMLLDTISRTVTTSRVSYNARAVSRRNRAAGLALPVATLPTLVRSILRRCTRQLGLHRSH